MGQCVEAHPSGGGITVAGKTFAFDAVCDDKQQQARGAHRARPRRPGPEPFARRAVRRAAQRFRRAFAAAG